MSKYIDADRLKELLDAKYKEFTEKAKKDCPLQYQYMADGLDIAEQFIDSLQQEQQEVGLEKEIEVASKRFPEVSFAKLSRIAKRFYELGLRAGQEYAATSYNAPCYCGGPCTNPMHDCINCPRQLSGRINTTTGTSSAKVEENK